MSAHFLNSAIDAQHDGAGGQWAEKLMQAGLGNGPMWRGVLGR
ncbi:MAG: hypothetical protein ACK542_01785 [Burkholderiales bacterium]